MAVGTSDYWGNKVLNATLAGAALSFPATTYIALFTTMPTKAGTGGVEVSTSGTAYARQAVTSNNTNYPAAVAQLIKLAVAQTYPTATADWAPVGTPVVGFGIYDALTSGNLLYLIPLVTTWEAFTAVTAGNKFTVPGSAYSNGNMVYLEAITSIALPGGFSADTVYYVISVSGDTFSLSATSGGGAITVTADGSGILGVIQTQPVLSGNTVSVAANALQIQGS